MVVLIMPESWQAKAHYDPFLVSRCLFEHMYKNDTVGEMNGAIEAD
jgi:hypothetical protein